MLRLAGLLSLTASMLSSQIPGDALHIEATLQGRTFAPRERAAIHFTVANRSPRPLAVPDPSRAGALRVRLRTPSGETTFSPGDAMQAPGTAPIRADWRLPPGTTRVFDFDLAALARISAPGSYTAVLEYAVPASPSWKSPDLTFTITPAGVEDLRVFEGESARLSHTASIVWTGREGAGTRAFLFPYAAKPETQEIWGATSIPQLPAGARPQLSIGPAGLDFPDRWLVWIDGPQLRYQYLAGDPATALAPAGIAIPADARLIRAPLAEAPPETGRAACHVAWISHATLQRATIDSRGRARLLTAVTLPAEPIDAWAVSPRSGERIYVIALPAGDQTQIVSVRCMLDACSPPVGRARIPGRVVAGDLRILGNDAAAAFVVSRPAGWTRVTLRLTPGAVPQSEPLPQVSHAERTLVRLDAAGLAQVALLDGGQLLYLRPGTKAPVRLPRAGPLFDFLPVPGAPALVVYDPASGPAFVPLPQ